MQTPILYIVVPCYNEEEVFPLTLNELLQKMDSLQKEDKISAQSKILFVDDGSKDGTWALICDAAKKYPAVSGITLSRNRGHQNALLAGLSYSASRCDVTVSMDADLQDDVNAVDEMLQKFAQGCHVVYGVRSDRKKDSFFKRATARGFYRFMKWMGVETVYDHADYRLMSAAAVKELLRFPEEHLYLRGMVPLVGFKSDSVYYKRGKRAAGESKYPLHRMISFALDGLTSFSVKPLQLISRIGWLLTLVGAVLLICSICGTVDWLLTSIWLVGGIQLTAMGVLGTYIGRTFRQTQQRPRFIIAASTDEEFLEYDLAQQGDR